MIGEEHSNKHINLFTSGVDRDIDATLVDSKKGFYYDAENMAIRMKDEHNFVLQTIEGEKILFNPSKIQGVAISSNLATCIGMCICGGRLVEFFVPLSVMSSAFNPFIMVDGQIVCSSNKLGFIESKPLQIAVNDNCNGGLVGVTDNYNIPYLFEIQDMIDNIGTDKYFTSFNPSNYTVTLQISIDKPIFGGLLSSAGGSLSVGNYVYSIRYSDATGNKTNWSPVSEVIPVPKVNDSNSPTYVGNKIQGAVDTTQSVLGIQLFFRVNNVADYSYLEIKRVFYNGSYGSSTGFAQYKKLNNIITGSNANKYQIITIKDLEGHTSTNWLTLSDEGDIGGSSSISTAKAIAFHNNRLILANVNTMSKDIDGWNGIYDWNGKKSIPVIQDIGYDGHKNIYNQVKYKSRFRGEKYVDGIKFIDGYGNSTFAKEVAAIQMPNRRDKLEGFSLWNSANPTICSDIKNDIGYTYEAFDIDSNYSNGKKTDTGLVSIESSNYNPLTPVKCTDSAWGGTKYKVNIGYDSNGFGVRYKSLGTMFRGFHNFPTNATAFSIVTRPKANKVFAQGIGIYSLNQGTTKYWSGFHDVSYKSAMSKDKNTLTVYFPDLQSRGQALPDFSTGRYKIQLVSPLGFFSEVYGGSTADSSNVPTLVNFYKYSNQYIDLISYARILHEKGDINPNLLGPGSTSDYYSQFGAWRNDLNSSNNVKTSSNKIFTIANVSSQTDDFGYNNCYKITLNDNIYDKDTLSGAMPNENDYSTRNFYEPFYIINIIDEGADIINGNQDNYFETGHLQKIRSLIGVYDSTKTTFPLIDERPEDCLGYLSTEKRYLSVGDRLWLGISNLYSSDKTYYINLLSHSTTGYIDVPDLDIDGNSTIIRVYGLYDSSYNNTYYNWNIEFNVKNTVSGFNFLPNNKDEIVVLYDARVPIKLFNGDCYLGETVFAPINKSSGNGDLNDFTMNAPFPRLEYYFNTNYRRIFDSHQTNFDGYSSICSIPHIKIGGVRQLIVMFCCETKLNFPLSYGIDGSAPTTTLDPNGTFSDKKNFPLVNYIQRPIIWDNNYPNNFKGQGDKNGIIDLRYLDNFPQEWQNWKRGGFNFKPQINLNYSKTYNNIISPTKPLLGFKEVTHFCSRISYSNTKDVNSQDNTNYKTFPPTSLYLLTEQYGEIKYITSVDTAKGSNLFVVTEKGVALVFTDKTVLSQVNATDLGLIFPNNKFITSYEFLTGDVGCEDEMWRGIAEYNNMIFIPNHRSIYVFDSLKLKDIGRDNKGGYYSKIFPIISNIKSGIDTPLTSIYNEKDEEFWFAVGNNNVRFNLSESNYKSYTAQSGDLIWFYGTALNPVYTLPQGLLIGGQVSFKNNSSVIVFIEDLVRQLISVLPGESCTFTMGQINFSKGEWINNARVYCYNNRLESWIGEFDYEYEKMLGVKFIEGKNDYTVVGVKHGVTYSLDNNTLIVYDNSFGTNISKGLQSTVTFVVSPQKALSFTKELVNILINSNIKPKRVEFASSSDLLPECFLDSSISQLYLKDYLGGYYQQVPRKTNTSTKTGLRNRLQNDIFFVKVISSESTVMVLKQVLSSYKILK